MTPEAMLARHARSFAPAARLLAREDRARIARLYALCRTVDDLADTVGGAAVAQRLTAVAEDLSRCGDAGSDPLAAEARTLFAARPTGLASFAQLVATVARDTGPTCLADDAALDAYCMGVAGTVGVMVCALFDVPSRWHAAAADLGRAMQLTNICRDVAEDARAGRRYLPHTVCPHSPSAIVAGDARVHADVRRAVAELLLRADAFYASGWAGLPALPLRLRLAVTAAAAMYAGIGDELRARACDPSAGRAFVPGWRKAMLVARGIGSNLLPGRQAAGGLSHAAP